MARKAVTEFRCSVCGEVHPGPPLSYGFDAPIYWYGIPEEQRSTRGSLDQEQCVIDEEAFFIKGCVDVPLTDDPTGVFRWVVWVSLSRADFERASEQWDSPGREQEPAYFGWLSSRIPGYPDTLNLKTHVHTRPVGERPQIELEPTDHPLAREQREGISGTRLHEIAEALLHSGRGA